ncbi:hypothetical protein NE573_23535, partial [Parabacteroides distasonis]|nr:hypothetical protein [Parabacteroides distasonis]
DNERKLIKDKLKEGALLFIQQQGVRKTSVDELVKYANISKYQMGGENNVNLEKVRTLLATSKLASDYLHKSDFSNFTELLASFVSV